MPGSDERPMPRGRGAGRLLVVGSLALAVVAAAALAVGSNDARLLRLGVVAALWAGLVGAFAAVRMRREVSSGAERAEDKRRIYQLELEREVAARREHELTVERDLRRRVQRDSRNEVDAMRAELRTLRENLETLLGGELLVERVALRAESTRLRSLPEQQPASARPLAVAAGSDPRRATGGSSPSAARTGSGDRPSRPAERPGSATPGPSSTWSPAVARSSTPPGRPAASAREDTASRAEPSTAATASPRRDPAARDATDRRTRPETPAAPAVRSFEEDPLFGEAPWLSTPTWTPSWEATPKGWDPASAAEPPGGHRTPGSPSRDPLAAPAVPEGNRARPAEAPTNGAWPAATAKRREPEPGQSAPTGGRSVEDLIAAYGVGAGPRHRWRREDD